MKIKFDHFLATLVILTGVSAAISTAPGPISTKVPIDLGEYKRLGGIFIFILGCIWFRAISRRK